MHPLKDSTAALDLVTLHVDRSTLAVTECTPLFAATMGYDSTDDCVAGFFRGPHLQELTRIDLMGITGSIVVRNNRGDRINVAVEHNDDRTAIVLALDGDGTIGLMANLSELFPEYGVALLDHATEAVTWLSSPPLPLGGYFPRHLLHLEQLESLVVPDDYTEVLRLLDSSGTADIRLIGPEGVIQRSTFRTVWGADHTLLRIRPLPADDHQKASDRSQGHHILLVEDDALVRRFLTQALTSAGHELSTAGSAQQATGLLRKPDSTVTLVISDLNLPDSVDGRFITGLRQDFPDLPVISCSGNPDPGLADAHVSKPVERHHLLSTIAEVCQ